MRLDKATTFFLFRSTSLLTTLRSLVTFQSKSMNSYSVRKVCSNEPLYNAPPVVYQHINGQYVSAPHYAQQHTGEHMTLQVSSPLSLLSNCAPSPFLSAVILLNSPANGKWEFEEYQRLYKQYRSTKTNYTSNAQVDNNANTKELNDCDVDIKTNTSIKHALPHCYFICADGAYQAMCTYFASTHKPISSTSSSSSSSSESLLMNVTSEHTSNKDKNSNINNIPLCDVIIGDMDSCDCSKLHKQTTEKTLIHNVDESNRNVSSTNLCNDKTQLKWFETVNTIPDDVLEVVHNKACFHERYHCKLNEEELSEKEVKEQLQPVILPVACQMTTDFRKCVLLLKRLKHNFPFDFGLTQAENEALEQLSTHTCSIVPETINDGDHPSNSAINNNRSEEVHTIHEKKAETSSEEYIPASYKQLNTYCTELITHELHHQHHLERELVDNNIELEANEQNASKNEEARCKAFLCECIARPPNINNKSTFTTNTSNETSSKAENKVYSTNMKTVILPNVAVLGALGGRFDHEMGVASCLLKYVKDFHLMVTNRYNVMFACWPDGVTQWVSRTYCGANPSTEHTISTSTHTNSENGAKPHKSKPVTCGVIPYGEVVEMETTGLEWNVVNGRPNKCDDITQTNSFRFSFDELVSTSNIIKDDIVTIDLRQLYNKNVKCTSNNSTEAQTATATYNPPTIFTS